MTIRVTTRANTGGLQRICAYPLTQVAEVLVRSVRPAAKLLILYTPDRVSKAQTSGSRSLLVVKSGSARAGS